MKLFSYSPLVLGKSHLVCLMHMATLLSMVYHSNLLPALWVSKTYMDRISFAIFVSLSASYGFMIARC